MFIQLKQKCLYSGNKTKSYEPFATGDTSMCDWQSEHYCPCSTEEELLISMSSLVLQTFGINSVKWISLPMSRMKLALKLWF